MRHRNQQVLSILCCTVNIALIALLCISEIRPYMFDALLYLVGVHAQVSSAAEPLLERTLEALVEDLAREALRCFRQVKRFGMGGMLRVSPFTTIHHIIRHGSLMVISIWFQATLEIEFMHQTLSRYVTQSAARTLSELYNKISQAYARRPGDENLQSNLDGVKKTLADTRRATGIEFLCFRQNKDKAGTASRSGMQSARVKDKDVNKGGKESKESLSSRS